MSPTPSEVGRGFLSEFDSRAEAWAECARIIYESVERAKAKLGGNPVRFVGLILDDDCVHPVIKETKVSEKRSPSFLVVENQITCYALGGEGFSGLFDSYVGPDEKGLGIEWTENKSVYYRRGEWFSGGGTWLRICAEGEPVSKVGVIFFPQEMVEKEYSVERLLGWDKVAFDPQVFTPLLRGLKRASGLE